MTIEASTQPTGGAITPADLDSTIHAPKRLAALAILRTATEAEFAYLQRRLDLSASDLSKQMTTLTDAGLIEVRKTGQGRGSSTWYSLTDAGRAEFDAYKTALRALLEQPEA